MSFDGAPEASAWAACLRSFARCTATWGRRTLQACLSDSSVLESSQDPVVITERVAIARFLAGQGAGGAVRRELAGLRAVRRGTYRTTNEESTVDRLRIDHRSTGYRDR